MIVDFFLFLLPFTPKDFLFVGHHLMTTGYMMSSLYIGRGGLSCLILMVLGESTSLFQNSWLISRELRRESRVSIIYLTCCGASRFSSLQIYASHCHSLLHNQCVVGICIIQMLATYWWVAHMITLPATCNVDQLPVIVSCHNVHDFHPCRQKW